MPNIKQTVNLREEMARKKKQSQVNQIKSVYDIDEEGTLKKINRPNQSIEGNAMSWKNIFLIIVLAIVLVFSFFYYFDVYRPNKMSQEKEWQAIKLINEEMFYGQIKDIGANPVVVNNVYYNYDQINEERKDDKEMGNIRLVKRGQETHGPTGSMSIISSQILFIEPLGEDSKVLRAILDYEK